MPGKENFMQMLYNSDSYVVVQIEMQPSEAGPLTRGGFEIVDKRLRTEIFIEGALAESFKTGVQALVENNPSVEQLDDYIAGFTHLGQQPLVMH
jgi:hypothetical protein